MTTQREIDAAKRKKAPAVGELWQWKSNFPGWLWDRVLTKDKTKDSGTEPQKLLFGEIVLIVDSKIDSYEDQRFFTMTFLANERVWKGQHWNEVDWFKRFVRVSQ